MSTPHVIVIGAGSTGSATAHDLALRGLRVTVIERGEVASGTTGRNHCLRGIILAQSHSPRAGSTVSNRRCNPCNARRACNHNRFRYFQSSRKASEPGSHCNRSAYRRLWPVVDLGHHSLKPI